MTTTIHKKVKGSVMEQIFDKAETLSVRYYNTSDVEDKDYDATKEYNFEIVIRHPEETDAKKLFNSAIKKFS